MDLSDDLLTVDGLEPVTVQERDGALYAVPSALHTTPKKAERELSAGRYLRAEAVWHFQAKDLPGVDLLPGSTITDGDGTTWVVLSTEHPKLLGKWRVLCSNLSLALPDTVTVEVRTASQTAMGATQWSWSADGSAPTAGKVHVIASAVEVGQDMRDAMPEQAKLYVASNYQFVGQHRVKDSIGRYWEVLGANTVDELDFLQVVDLRRMLGEA